MGGSIRRVLPDLPADDQMRIATPRLELVPLTADDAVDLFSVLDDPALGRWTGQEPPSDVAALRRKYAVWTSRRSPAGDELWLNWVVRRRDDDRAAGHLQATVGAEHAEVAWVIGTRDQHQGLATEAARAVITWLLESLGTDFIVACIHPDHLASQAVAGRVGMHPTERRDDGEVVWEYLAPPLR